MGEAVPRREDLCCTTFMSIKRDFDDRVAYTAFPLRCKSWDCPDCAAIKAKEYVSRMGKLFDGRKLWFITLTYRHDVSETFAWLNYNKAWNRLRTNISKNIGKFSYARVLESHRNSAYPHLHLIVDRYVRPSVFGPAAIAAGFGYQMDFKQITSDGARHYVTKYLTKPWSNAEGRRLEKECHCRRVSFSADIKQEKQETIAADCLSLPGTMENALEAMEIDRTWDVSRRFTLVNEVRRVDLVHLEFLVDDVSDGYYLRTDVDEWEPEEYVPK